ncbi:nitroreductase/quinone reductase family protein [Bailinhaonella thermotolerans]|uniref:Nitroreductase family deazaflavin-dependent oxidoreductase n=1 Tax=Bailinhaonella thermotolerans TaxID=1070861 RepID=A0A3A4B619_9ACTN|nr:nitroreductase/quinone reductase family protein [Bailinhaonella thermotolerans]RJL36080.1 nitroreductase family deazaflavin-dependent oxidoreductase [Bailinhaonella thermotolerans]
MSERKRRAVSRIHRLINPVMRPLSGRIPGQALLETVGRRTGLPRRTPVGGRVEGGSFWFVSDHGRASQYIRNIEKNDRVRVRIGGRWHTGTAVPLPDDDPRRRLRRLPAYNGLLVRLLGTDLLTVRVDLDRPGDRAAGGGMRD